MSKNQEKEVKIEFLNERGYGVGFSENQQIQILGSLPGELVRCRVFKKKKGVLFATAETILSASACRVEPKEEHFLSCSPLQILDFDKENRWKQEFVKSEFSNIAGIELSDFQIAARPANQTNYNSWGYRNKVEYSFYSDDNGKLSLAFFKREGAFAKFPHLGCVLVHPEINRAALKILKFLESKKLIGKQLKSLILRYSFAQNAVIAGLFLKDENLNFKKNELEDLLDDVLVGLKTAYSTHKSPASVVSKLLHSIGKLELTESLEISPIYANKSDKTPTNAMNSPEEKNSCPTDFKVLLNSSAQNGKKILHLTFGLDSFFQVNVPMFNKVIFDLRNYLHGVPKISQKTLVDLYAGVGTIGLLLADLVDNVVAVEVFPGSKKFAVQNCIQNEIENFNFIEASAEKAMMQIDFGEVLIVDPPRNGLSKELVNKILYTRPEIVCYLSCNPKTQAEYMSKLNEIYEIKFSKLYNFYPHTPHVESLLILSRRKEN